MSRILLVDDDPDILSILAAAFECGGHGVHLTPDPTEVETLLHGERFDAVVLDVMMPARSGWDVLEELRRNPRTERLPVLMLSAIGDAANRVRGIRMGADDFLSKPFCAEEVVVRVESLVKRRTADRPGLQGDLSVFPLSEAVQTVMNGLASGILNVKTPASEGNLHFLDGRCLEARFDGLEGGEAVLWLLRQRQGTFRLHLSPWPVDLSKPEPLPLSRLLLEAVWIEDELRLREPLLPADTQGLAAAVDDADVLASPAGLPELPLAPILSLLQRRPGSSLLDLLAAHLASPERVRLAVAWLVEVAAVFENRRSAGTILSPFVGETA